MNATASVPLTAADRCDRCGSRAYLRVVMPTGGELLFCGHHANRHENALRERSTSFEDQRDALLEKTSSAPDES